MVYHLHTGFHYCKLLTCLSYEYGSLSYISGMDLGGSVYRQILVFLGVKKFLTTKITYFECMLASG